MQLVQTNVFKFKLAPKGFFALQSQQYLLSLWRRIEFITSSVMMRLDPTGEETISEFTRANRVQQDPASILKR